MDKLQLRNIILDRIERPQIPALEYSALEFGARPDEDTVQTGFLQNAIDAAGEKGGGRIVIPAGHYRTGALRLRSGVELHLESEHTVLSFINEDPEEHYPVVFSHWEASPCYNFSPLVYACDAHDIALTGKGILDGGADKKHWWNWHHQVEDAWSLDREDLQLDDRNALRKMNGEGIPVEQRIFGPGHFLRPNFIQFIRCSRVLIQGITLKNSPMWQVNPVMCKSLTVDGVTLSSHGANNDGCDPESCCGVHIVNCRFDTGDDCISLKSGRDRDGRKANIPCEYVLIENNEFADGHGGVAIGSEMSGGVRCVLAWKNRFTSPNLTYALRLKTNAKRGGKVEEIILADSVLSKVHGAAVHGTMLYEDGRNGSDLPVFQNITIENITASGGDYGIFLEAFKEVPITGLVLKNITIDGAGKAMRSMNWKDPVVENVVINRKKFPRPQKVRIAGVPKEGSRVEALAEICGGRGECRFTWEVSRAGESWEAAERGETFCIPGGCRFVRVTACDQDGNEEKSRAYRILSQEMVNRLGQDYGRQRLACRRMMDGEGRAEDQELITRGRLARMLMPLAESRIWEPGAGQGQEGLQEIEKREETEEKCLLAAIENGFLAESEACGSCPEGTITRQEMATVAMEACGISYRNASSTMPVCADGDKVSHNYGTNVARALYFGFMELDGNGCFHPRRQVTLGEAVRILNRVADFAGI